jgi:asparagine synthase (glutamine-hydrolysing)
MCGVSALLLRDPQADAGGILERLSAGLVHRGPDGHGLILASGRSAGLAHRRLSILDLHTGGQPMANEDASVHVSFNGEIYNYRALRKELEQAGHHFASQADTEVLVHGWEEWGPRLPERLNGIFAFVVLDCRRGTGNPEFFLARDPVGAKPLYVGEFSDGWWVASELDAAQRAGLVDGGLSAEALGEFLVYRFIPAPRTPFRRAWKLPPASFVQIDRSTPAGPPDFHSYRYAAEERELPGTDAEWAEALRSGIRAAVARQLMSDVPVGSLLSGGVDSVLVTALMGEASGGVMPTCFAIGFEAADGGEELTAARRAAASLGAPLRAVHADDEAYLRLWARQAAMVGEPIANSGVLLVGLLCAEVRRTHKVVLSGQGADEPLGGYPRHAAARLRGVARGLRPVLRALPDGILASDRLDRLRRIGRGQDEAGWFTELLAVFEPEVAASMLRTPLARESLVAPMKAALAVGGGDDCLNRLLLADARLSLADDLLMVADRMSMAHSVELRVPFLDLELLGLVTRMPSRLKVSWLGERKWFYRRAVAPLLPADLRQSLLGPRARLGRKLGFATPLDRWFSRWADGEAERTLLGPDAVSPAVLDPDGVRRVIMAARDRHRSRARQLMSLFVLEAWLRTLNGSTRPSVLPASAA